MIKQTGALVFFPVLIHLPAYSQNFAVNSDFNHANVCEYNSPCSPRGWYTSYDIDWAYQRIHHFGTDGTNCIFISAGPDVFNYWQSELVAPLSKGLTYKLEYAVKNTEGSTDTSAVQIGFLPSRIHLLEKKQLDSIDNVSPEKIKIRNGKYGWTKISFEFEASGNERWIIIGKTGKVTANSRQLYAVDDLKLSPVKKETLSAAFIEQRTKELISNRKRHELRLATPVNNDTLPLNKIPDAAPVVVTDTIQIPDVLFETDSFRLKEHTSSSLLNSIVKDISSRRFEKVIINGHTDNSGSDANNLELSKKRAEAVRDYLINAGIPGEKIAAEGYGSTRPVNDNSSEEQKRKNRRVEVLILSRE